MAKTNWQMGDTVLPSDLNQIGQEINENAAAIADHAAATTGVHGATSEAAPNTIVQRDAEGRIKAAAPVTSDDVARKQEVDAVQSNLDSHKSAAVLDHPDGSVTTAKLADGAVTSTKLSSGAVTDSVIGNRTISDSSAPSGDSGTLTSLLSWLANMIKAITGKSSWRTAPATTLEAAKAHIDATSGVHGATSAATANRIIQRDSFGRAKVAAPSASDDIARKAEVDVVQTNLNNHIADYVRHPGYAAASGSANTYSVTLSPAPSAYTDGMAVAIKINVNNTGASTLNVNGLGAKSIKKPNGSDVSAGNLRAGSIYTLRYNASSGNFILQGEGGYGTGDVIGDTALVAIPGGMGAEVWSTSEVQARGVVTDNHGNVYVVYYSSDSPTIQKLDKNGNIIWSNSELPNATNITLDSAGYIYVIYTNALRKLDPNGNEIWRKTGSNYSGSNVAVDGNGYIYITQNAVSSNKPVQKLDNVGNEIWANAEVKGANGIAIGSQGKVYVASSSSSKSVRVLDNNGVEINYNSQEIDGRAIAVNPEGYIYTVHFVSQGSRVFRKLDQNLTEVWFISNVNRGIDVFVDSYGENVYTAYQHPSYGNTSYVYRYDKHGDAIWSVADTNTDPYRVHVDSDGYVYVASTKSTTASIPNPKTVRKLDGNRYYQIMR